jgi:hypothetical protein
VKTNETVINLSRYLADYRPDVIDLSAGCKGTLDGRFEDFVAKYRTVCIDAACAPTGVDGVTHFKPSSEDFSFEKRGVSDYVVKRSGSTSPYARMGAFVDAGGLVTLIEMRLAEPGKGERYFKASAKKIELLTNLAGENHAWILMVPLDHLKATSVEEAEFKRKGGQVVILPYMASEMRDKVYFSASLENSSMQF